MDETKKDRTLRDFALKASRKMLDIWNPTGEALAAEFWISGKKASSGRSQSGFSPVCRNKFDRAAGCKLGKGTGCRECTLKELLPISEEMLFKHILGKKPKDRRGIYPMLPGDLTAWIAADLDNHDGKKDPLGDLTKLIEVARALDLPITVFSSNSGKGFHTYLFSEKPIPAAKARSLLLALLDRAGIDISHRRDKEGSFDCLFPKQDSLEDKDIGNLIALPYFGDAVRERHASLVIDPGTLEPFGSSLEENFEFFLETMRPMAETEVDGALKEMGISLHRGNLALDLSNTGSTVQLPEIVEKCAFLNHCRDDAPSLPEPDWYMMVCILAREYGGPALVHELSRGYPGYSREETQQKINHALMDQPGPITCKKVKEIYDCGKDCGVVCPIQVVSPRRIDVEEVTQDEAESALSEFLKQAEEGNEEAPFDAVPYLAMLPKREDMKWRRRFKRALTKELNLNHLGEAINEIRKMKKKSTRKRETIDSKGRHRINISSGQLWEITDKALSALEDANHPQPSVFVRAGTIVRVRSDERGRPLIEPFSESALRGALARVACWVKDSPEGDVDANPPLEAVRDILSLPRLNFPSLEAIIETPTIRPDGSILDLSGYDTRTGLFYIKAENFNLPPIPQHPTRENAQRAANYIFNELLSDFPFKDQPSRANTMALILTSLLRQSLIPKSPLALIDAPQAGTGKSLLAEIAVETTTGHPAAMTTAPEDTKFADEEWRKRITSMLRAGINNIIIDNVEGVLDSPSLAAVLTLTTWSDRILGRNEQITLPQKSAWIATGNNIRPGGDLPRRCYWIRLDAKMVRPFLRSEFKHSDLVSWVREHRGEIIAALLCMARAWFVAGKPKSNIPDVGSFEVWSRTIGGILEYAGVEGFLGNAEELYDTDDEMREWELFTEAWHDLYGTTGVTIARLTDDLSETSQNDSEEISSKKAALKAMLPGDLADILDRSPGRFKKLLGKRLLKQVGVHFSNGFSFEKGIKDPHSKRLMWKVIKAESTTCGVCLQETPQGNMPISQDLRGLRGLDSIATREEEPFPLLRDGNGKRGKVSLYTAGMLQTPQTPQNSKHQMISKGYSAGFRDSNTARVTCSGCIHFDGRWCVAECSWDGKRSQEGDEEHVCRFFEPRALEYGNNR